MRLGFLSDILYFPQPPCTVRQWCCIPLVSKGPVLQPRVEQKLQNSRRDEEVWCLYRHAPSSSSETCGILSSLTSDGRDTIHLGFLPVQKQGETENRYFTKYVPLGTWQKIPWEKSVAVNWGLTAHLHLRSYRKRVRVGVGVMRK